MHLFSIASLFLPSLDRPWLKTLRLTLLKIWRQPGNFALPSTWEMAF